ncbi:DUF4142 domain-containing protein [Mucilaginibacter sp. SP1R1]|uniref:DUF4142 domain-containing protein n=1 Tax=Mucilaginibacter sp. SP1R1 TaxID=2723091 RepID=UPI00160DC9A8|nr:DUF4142 domain-containing protein [Mucilaginibacter sp. SP1R1]MBB6149769.1 putative membrane protein [Mucilaginibacter sp. SP1R1]
MKQIAGLLLGLMTLVLVQSCQSNKRANNYNNKALVDDSGLVFLNNGVETSQAIVKASGLAISNSRNQQVIQFAKKMIDDHTQLATDLKKLQADNFVTAEDSINTPHQQIISSLAQKHAAAFDKAYLQEIITEHQQEISLYNAAGKDKSANISDFAQKTLPALNAHLDSAKAISLSLK